MALTIREEGCNFPLGVEVGSSKADFVVICKVWGELTAHVIKTHLESEEIPVLLKYESVGIVYGITTDGLGQISVLVPQQFAEEAKRVIEPQEIE
jgi:hypothetical protein